MQKEYLPFNFFNIIFIIVVIILLSIVISNYVLGELKGNCLVNMHNDLEVIADYMNNSVSDDPQLLYGKKVERVSILKNSVFYEYLISGQVMDHTGVVTKSSIDGDNNVIVDLSPFIMGLDVKNTCGKYVAVSSSDRSSLAVYFIDSDDLDFVDIPLKSYYELMSKKIYKIK